MRSRLLVGLGTIATLVAAPLAVPPVAAAPAAPASATGEGHRAATARLAADADGPLTTAPGFVGVPSGVTVDNPAVRPGTAPTAAARSHLERYGAALGVDADQLVGGGVTRTVAGTQAVRFTQEVAGVPVIGGEVVVSVGADGELASAQATVSSRSRVATPVVGEDEAARRALTVAARAAGVPASTLVVSRSGRWLLDPVALGAPARLGTHTVWRFDVADGLAVRRTVLVDVRTGAVVMNLDAIQHLERVVCDSQNIPVDDESDCTGGFARTETGPASSVVDVNDAFDYSGAVSDFYAEIGGIDLTEELGLDIDGERVLTSTVRFCRADSECPYPNAFWNGKGMFYGEGFAAADDVVGHEMTHGIIDRTSGLFYWGQSGAINESIADIMGEIVDHRNPSPGDRPDDWAMGEALHVGAARDLADPRRHDQPDRMTSNRYWDDPDYQDQGGVHVNSGVGNKTAYLISQGGRFNGRSITGIDAGDPGLTKTATLYLLTLQSLASGSDYADLALVLEASCQQLVGGPAGLSTADCASVREAGLATELSTTPTRAPQPTDAPLSCPSGEVEVLFESESGDDPAAKFAAPTQWTRDGIPGWGSIATSGRESWSSLGSETISVRSLRTAQPVTLPPGQASYLWFQHWRVLDHDQNGFYDGGKVEIDGADTQGLSWINGPRERLFRGSGNPAAGTRAFGGDSRGFVASRVDLSSYAGQAVTPGFTLYTDESVATLGWALDDITVYTCVGGVANITKPSIAGKPKVGRKLTARRGSWQPDGLSFRYTWLRNGQAIRGAASRTYRLKGADRGKRISVRVTASADGLESLTLTSSKVGPIR